MKEIYELIDNMFQVLKINYNLRKLANTWKNSVKMGLETISPHAPQLCNLAPKEVKDDQSLSTFIKTIKTFIVCIGYAKHTLPV